MAKILFIAPGEEIKDSIAESIEEYKRYAIRLNRPQVECDIDIIVELDYDKINVDKHNADIIVSRGALASSLRYRLKNIPIVELPITTIDIINSVREIQPLNPKNLPIAVIGFGDVPYQLRTAADLCDAQLIPFDYYNDKIRELDLLAILDQIVSRGFSNVIGGVRTTNLARDRGLTAVSIKSGRESIWPALTEALHIAHIRRTERERAARFESILNHVHEGIIATDTGNRIIQVNSSASEMLDLKLDSCVNTPLERILPDPRVSVMLRDEKTYQDELLKHGANRFVLNKTAIRLANETIGNLITFQKISAVQNTEIAIRSKLHHRGLTAKYSFADIIGDSPVIQETIRKAKTFAQAPSNILIIGHTGTGKELFAQSIHQCSTKKYGPFIAVNCAAIPENLMESEFFGYESGAFTGASKEGKPGFFELAHQGTIFLDEITEIPSNLQGKFLRVLQESEVMRIGSDRIIPVNVRIVCAVNKDLKALVADGKFREDLFYRLAVLQLRLPSLKERGDDILLLAEHFIEQYASTFLKRQIKLDQGARRALLLHPWDGNIRELRNVCEQLVVLNATGTIGETDVGELIPAEKNRVAREPLSQPSARTEYGKERKNLERIQILAAMNECGCNKTQAADRLGMDRTTLWRKLKDYGIDCRTTIGHL